MPTIKEKLALLPDNPGCYLMKDKDGTIIYVGKAKVLKNRVKSYFTGSHDAKTQRLVSEIKDFEYIVTASNVEALVLEINLIKKHNPKYNILLKDDKQYPYIKITKEKHPKLVIVRKVLKDGAKYFGPYPNAGAASEVKKLLDRLYPLRKCKNLPKEVCLYYHIGQCLAPCVFEVTDEQNKEIVEGITKFLKGDTKSVKQRLTEKMNQASEMLEFEKAKDYRDQVRDIEQIMEKQTIVSNDLVDRDIFGFSYNKGWLCIQVFFVRGGKLIEREAATFPFYGEANDDVLTFIGQFYEKHPKPKEILLPKELDKEVLEELLEVKVLTPQRGDKKELVKLAEKNAEIALNEKFALFERNEEKTANAIERLGKYLRIETPIRIEAFDNSNIQGTDAVSAMVVFTNGKPDKKEYRKYKIKTVVGPDDYESMREVIKRRYTKVINENLPKPDLIVIDGGKGQIEAARGVLKELSLSIPVCGLAKDEKHKTSELLAGDPLGIIPVPRDDQAFYLLQRIQDEVHRFAITFFRQTHNKTTFKSKLDDIEGVGEKRKMALMRHFGTLEKIKEATIDEFKKVGIPENVANKIKKQLKSE